MKKNKKRKERMAAASAIANPSVSSNEKYNPAKALKRQREEDFVNGKLHDKAKHVDSPQKKRKGQRDETGEQNGQAASQKFPGKSEKSPQAANGLKTSDSKGAVISKSKSGKLDFSTQFLEQDRLLPGPKRQAMTQSYISSKPLHPLSMCSDSQI